MIKNILYVEDGSVDVDELQESLNEETKIIIYRQGSKPPILEQPKEPIKTYRDDRVASLMRTIERARDMLAEVMSLEVPEELLKMLDDIYTELN